MPPGPPVAARKQDLHVLLESANRWTDNIFTFHKVLQEKHNMEKKEANKYLEINDDFDYIENVKLPA